MGSKMRASGRKRAKGCDKADRKLESRIHEWNKISVVDRPAYKCPGTRKKLD